MDNEVYIDGLEMNPLLFHCLLIYPQGSLNPEPPCGSLSPLAQFVEETCGWGMPAGFQRMAPIVAPRATSLLIKLST